MSDTSDDDDSGATDDGEEGDGRPEQNGSQEDGDGHGQAVKAEEQAGQRLEAAERQLAKLQRSSSAAQALVVHTAAVSETVLQKAGVKLKGGRKRAALVEHNASAFAQGKKDAAQINLEQGVLL